MAEITEQIKDYHTLDSDGTKFSKMKFLYSKGIFSQKLTLSQVIDAFPSA